MSSFVSPRSLEAKQVLNSPFGISGQLLLGGDINISVFRLCLLFLYIFLPSKQPSEPHVRIKLLALP